MHSVLAKCGVAVPMSDLFGTAGQTLLDDLALPAPYHARVISLRRLIDAFAFEIDLFAGVAPADCSNDTVDGSSSNVWCTRCAAKPPGSSESWDYGCPELDV